MGVQGRLPQKTSPADTGPLLAQASGSGRRIGSDQAARAPARAERNRTARAMRQRRSHENGVEVPPTHLTPEALRSLTEEFVTRDGTDYGPVETTLAEKMAALMCQLERGEAAILYDGVTRTINIVPRHGLR